MGAAAIPYVVMAGASLISGYMGSQAAKKQGQLDSAAAKVNEEASAYAATDAEVRGGQEAARARGAGTHTQGAQRVALAANGVELQSGSALDLLVDTRTLSELDAQTAKNNAAREAWGYRVQAKSYQVGGMGARTRAGNEAAGSILGGLGGAASAGSAYAGRG